MDLVARQIYGLRKLLQTSFGLIFKDDFTDISKWSPDPEWTQVEDPTMVVFDRSPYIALEGGRFSFNHHRYSFASGVSETTDSSGVRESSLLIDDDGTWYLYHDGGDGSQPWRGQVSESKDKGLTWKKYGDMGLGLNKYTSPGTTPNGTHAATSSCFTMKKDGIYYFYRFVAGNQDGGIPVSPYTCEVFSSTSPTSGWSWLRQATFTSTDSGINNTDSIGNSIIYYNGKYHLFGSDRNLSEYYIGRHTSDFIEGPWTRVIGSELPNTIKGQPENPRVFFSPFLNKWVMFVNQVLGTSPFLHTDRSSIFITSNPLDWSAATRLDVQHKCISDGLLAIGLPAQCLTVGLGYHSEQNYIPFTYDTDPTDASKHNGRKLRWSLLEPSKSSIKCSAASSPNFRKAVKIIDHNDFTAEFIIKYNGVHSGGLGFRTQINEDNYRIIVEGGGKLILQKSLSGTYNDLVLGSGVQLSQTNYFTNRLRINCVGNNIKGWLNGELQINYTDTSSPFLTGESISLVSNGAIEIRNLHLRKGNNVTINGLVAGDKVTLRGIGGYPIAQKQASGSSLVFGEVDNLNHFPVGEIDLNGVNVVKKIMWGGDVFTMTSHITPIYPPEEIIPFYNLKAYYPLNGNALDYTRKNNGVSTDITYTTGNSGQAAVFNGSSSKININNDPIFQLTKGSISLSVKATSAGSSFRALVVKSNAYGVFLNDGVLICYSWGAPVGIKSTNINLNTGIDNHIVMTFDSGVTNGTKIYLNKTLVLTTTTKVLYQNSILQIGANSTAQMPNAIMEGVGIWDVILSQEEVNEIYDKENSGIELI